MRTESNTKENIAPEIVYNVTPWRLTRVKPCENYKLEVEFNDGLQGVVDMSSLIMSDKAGVFMKLKDREFFKLVHLQYGVVTWPGEIDLAPDAMYQEISRNGIWILT